MQLTKVMRIISSNGPLITFCVKGSRSDITFTRKELTDSIDFSKIDVYQVTEDRSLYDGEFFGYKMRVNKSTFQYIKKIKYKERS